MTVRELIQKLQQQNQDAQVYYPLDGADQYREVTEVGRLVDMTHRKRTGVVIS
jgi:hypothetical protein